MCVSTVEGTSLAPHKLLPPSPPPKARDLGRVLVFLSVLFWFSSLLIFKSSSLCKHPQMNLGSKEDDWRVNAPNFRVWQLRGENPMERRRARSLCFGEGGLVSRQLLGGFLPSLYAVTRKIYMYIPSLSLHMVYTFPSYPDSASLPDAAAWAKHRY